MLLGDVVRLNAQRHPDAPAMQYEDRTWTFGEFWERICRLANGLQTIATPGDRIAILSENRPEYLDCYYGVPTAGMGLTFLNYRLHPRELVRIINDAGATVLITEPEYADAVESVIRELSTVRHIVMCGKAPGSGATAGAASSTAEWISYDDLLAGAPATEPERPGEDDLAWLIYTSGTTGMPKGAMLSHRNLMAGVTNSGLMWNHADETVVLFPWPLCHVSGYGIPVTHLYGYPLVLMRAYSPEAFLHHVERYRVTRTSMAPTMLNMLLQHPAFDEHDLSTLRTIGYGAAAMPVEVLRHAMERLPGVEFFTGFGMTELSGNIMYLSNDAHQRGVTEDSSLLQSVGVQMPLAVARVVDDDMNDVGVGEVGELVVQGEQVTMGYWNNPTATGEAFAGGWFHSGDLAKWDAEGNLYIVDRKKDMILTGGENVYSREVEEVLYQHDAVVEAAVIGVPDPDWGENVVAVIQRRTGANVDGGELVAFCRDHLAGYKKPKQVVFVDELPRNAAGKILKRELRTQVEAGELT